MLATADLTNNRLFAATSQAEQRANGVRSLCWGAGEEPGRIMSVGVEAVGGGAERVCYGFSRTACADTLL